MSDFHSRGGSHGPDKPARGVDRREGMPAPRQPGDSSASRARATLRGFSGDPDRDYRDDSPLSDAIRDAYVEGLNVGASWSSRTRCTDERDYAATRADVLEAEVRRLREERQAVLDCINLYGDETLHAAFDAIGFAKR